MTAECDCCPSYAELAARGAGALDRYFGHPNWDERVDLRRLDMASMTDCVLGQVFHNEARAAFRRAPRIAHLTGYQHGRDALHQAGVYQAAIGSFSGGDRMRRAWSALIRQRQAQRQAPTKRQRQQAAERLGEALGTPTMPSPATDATGDLTHRLAAPAAKVLTTLAVVAGAVAGVLS